MSSAVEKVQTQQVQHLAADQIQDQERSLLDEAKRTELQDPEGSNPTEPTHPDERGVARDAFASRNPAKMPMRKERGIYHPKEPWKKARGAI